ncbi:hypothetical protein J7E50_00920 [Pedobacter sp. ISL-68]|uniref:hypothetical protein n=1 Tax=unclassified Pedobacter TaxID=2628915 RepID=UPI001BE56CDF|nr:MULTISPECIES: hypothetical protein [unclassified Pedobacter]MBT2564549.1 hypothetical protein [Pedobacter sp. ISL-64]MBT2588761.1 hypothetical protein [Pedobacter sp. ISL-68]
MKVSSTSEAAARPKGTPLELIALIVSLVPAIIGFIEQHFLRFGDKTQAEIMSDHLNALKVLYL